MGVFSWKTQDTDRSIAVTGNTANRPTFTVYMFDNKGNVWKEDNYEGYGKFGGKDFYELLAEMNGKKTRDEGIKIAFHSGNKPFFSPNLAESPNWKWSNGEPESCECQGYFYWDEDTEDVDDYDEEE